MPFNLRLIPLLPFIGAALLMLFGRRWKRDTVVLVAATAILASCFVAFDAFFTRLPEAAERRRIVEQLAHADFPALDAAGGAGDAHGGGGGHH